MRGDLADLQNPLLGIADHNLQALNHVVAAMIPVAAIQELAFTRPAVGRAMWFQTLVDASIFREWTLNVGRRDDILAKHRDIRLQVVNRIAVETHVGQRRNQQQKHGRNDEAAEPVRMADPRIGFCPTNHGESRSRTSLMPF